MNKLGLYIHWPYCAKLCPYCDFNIYRKRNQDFDGLINAMLTEMRAWHDATREQKLHSIFLGGGTPSLLEPSQIYALLNETNKLWGFEQGIEITLETNPDDGALDKLRGFKDAGINRLSLGVQSFFDEGLKALGRYHSKDDALLAMKNARQVFDNLSIDMIYARPEQSLKDWEEELKIAASFDIDHISPYSLTIEHNTAFEKKVSRGTIKVPDDDLGAQFYDLTDEVLSSHGLELYEISNHARGKNFQSKHNLLYWQSQDFIGIGAGASSRIGIEGRKAYTNIKRPEEYIEAIKTGFAFDEQEELTQDEFIAEYYLMGLRLKEGIKIIENTINLEMAAKLEDEGLLKIENGLIKLSKEGRTLSNSIISALLD